MAWVDPNSVMNVATGSQPPASLFDTYRDDLEWLARNKPHCRGYNSANTAIANNAITAMLLNSERYDVGGMHSTSSNTSRITVPAGGDGVFTFMGNVSWAAVNTTGIRQINLRLNGATTIASNNDAAVNNAQLISAACHYALVAGDYVEMVVFQSSGGNLNIDAALNYSPEFSAMWECL